MKKIFVFLFAIPTLSGPAQAVEKCVPLGGMSTKTSVVTTTCSRSVADGGLSDWAVSCNTVYDGVGDSGETGWFDVTGIAQCSSQSGSLGSALTSLKTVSSNDAGDDKHCWCKMISPAISRWVFAYSYGTASKCSYSCVARCSYYLSEGADDGYKEAMFSEMSD